MYNSLLTYINMPNFLEYSKLLKFIPPNVMFKNIIVKNKGEKYNLALGSSAWYICSLHSFYDGGKPLYPGITNQDLRNMDFKMNGEVGINVADDTGFAISGRTAIFTFGERGCTIYEKLTGTNDPSNATTSNVTLYFLFSLG